MDTAAALQMAERVLSRHAQINSSFQASEPSACWPGARAQSAGMPGLVDILQRDSAAQRGSQGFEALDVQPLSRRPSGTYDSHLIHRPSSRPASRYSEQKARLQRRKVGCRRPAGRASTQGPRTRSRSLLRCAWAWGAAGGYLALRPTCSLGHSRLCLAYPKTGLPFSSPQSTLAGRHPLCRAHEQCPPVPTPSLSTLAARSSSRPQKWSAPLAGLGAPGQPARLRCTHPCWLSGLSTLQWQLDSLAGR